MQLHLSFISILCFLINVQQNSNNIVMHIFFSICLTSRIYFISKEDQYSNSKKYFFWIQFDSSAYVFDLDVFSISPFLHITTVLLYPHLTIPLVLFEFWIYCHVNDFASNDGYRLNTNDDPYSIFFSLTSTIMFPCCTQDKSCNI